MEPGAAAPDAPLPLHDGQSIRLASLWADRPVVLFFYPKDHTAVCTREACAFRDLTHVTLAEPV